MILGMWEKISDEEPDRAELHEPEEWGNQFKMKEDDRKDMTRAAARRIDTSNYVVFVSSTENHVSAIWKDRGERKLMPKQRESQQMLQGMRGNGVGRVYVAGEHERGVYRTSALVFPSVVI